jgi:hypothetical protein
MAHIEVFCRRQNFNSRGADRDQSRHGGFDQVYGRSKSEAGTSRLVPTTAVRVSRHPRDRMGLHDPSRSYARYQFKRNVHRSRFSSLGGCGIYRAPQTRSSVEGGLRGEARRAWARYGGHYHALRSRERKVFSATDCHSFETKILIPFYNKNDDTLS